MREILFLAAMIGFLTVCMQAVCPGAEHFIVTESHAPAVPVMTLNTEALQQLEQSRKREFIVYMAPFACPPCVYTHAQCGDGGEQFLVRYAPASEADFEIKAYPAVFLPDVRKAHYGGVNLQGLAAIDRKHPRPKNVSAVTIGTIQAKFLMEKVLAAIRPTGNTRTIDLGSAAIILPATLNSSTKFAPDSISIAFTGERPKLRVGNGWLSAARDVSAITASQNMLTVGVDGFSDLVFALQ